MAVWKSMDWANIDSFRVRNIYAEFSGAVKSASSKKDLRGFIEKMCARMGIRSISGKYAQMAERILATNDCEVLRILRNETQFVIILLRLEIDAEKEINA